MQNELLKPESLITILERNLGTVRAQLDYQELQDDFFIRKIFIFKNNIKIAHALSTCDIYTYNHFKKTLDNLGNGFLGKEIIYPNNFQRLEFDAKITEQSLVRKNIFSLEKFKFNVTEYVLHSVVQDIKAAPVSSQHVISI